MALPVCEKVWEFDINNLVNTGTVAGDVAALVFALKSAMVASGHWTVMLSSDSVSSGAADYWIDSGDLVWGTTGARSWIVLRSTVMGPTNFELLIECKWQSSSYIAHLAMRYAPAGDYSGGNTTTAPTCTNEQTLNPTIGTNYNACFISNGAANCGPRFWHWMNSDDGQCNRFIITQGGIANCCLLLERIKNPVSGLAASDQFVVLYLPDTGNTSISANISKFTTANLNATASLKSYVAGSGAITYYATGEFCGGGSKPINDMLVAPNPDDNNSWPILPVGLVTLTNVAYAYGRNGELYDIWWGPTSRMTGHTYPDDGSLDFIQLGEMILPWDGLSLPRVIV